MKFKPLVLVLIALIIGIYLATSNKETVKNENSAFKTPVKDGKKALETNIAPLVSPSPIANIPEPKNEIDLTKFPAGAVIVNSTPTDGKELNPDDFGITQNLENSPEPNFVKIPTDHYNQNGELPDDLKAQLNAKPELPEDMKAVQKMPSRTVTIEEVNNPKE